jgi:DNA replication protein DnaC
VASTDTSSSVEPDTGPDCSVCKGAGFVYASVPLGHADYGRAVPCRCLGQGREKRRFSQLQRYSNLGPLVGLTFDNLIPEGKNRDAEDRKHFLQAYEAAKAFVRQPEGWLLLVGPGGSGKTHLAAAIVNERLREGHLALFITVPDFLDHLRSAFGPASDMSYDDLFERVRNAPLLALDDLGMQSGTPWAKEKLEQLLTHRFHAQLPTVIATDAALEELGERIGARLSDAGLCRAYVLRDKPCSRHGYEGVGLSEIPLLRTMTFDSFDLKRANLTPEQRQNLEHAYRAAQSFAQSPQGWLVLQGGQGCGKTHLAAAIANYQVQLDKPVLFVIVPDFLDHLRSTFSPESKVSYDELFEKVKKAPLLVLDDFTYTAVTPWAQEKLYQVVNYRYNSRLATVITSSLSLEEIDGRISSRMADLRLSTVLNIMASDYRSELSMAPKQHNTTLRPRRGRAL